MAFFDWKDDYSVNIREFDRQHKRLIDLLNELFNAMQEGKGKEVLSRVLNELTDYTVSHFEAEIKVMQSHGYPGLDEHKKEHDKLTDKVLKFKGDFESGKLIMSVDLMHFLKDWLRVHILGTDKQYSEYLNGRGVM